MPGAPGRWPPAFQGSSQQRPGLAPLRCAGSVRSDKSTAAWWDPHVPSLLFGLVLSGGPEPEAF